MKIADNKVVLFHYALVNSEGEVLDGSRGGEPLPYLHGHQNIVPGLEEALAGHEVGDHFKVTVTPEKGYGLRDEEKVQALDPKSFEGFDSLEVGMLCQMDDDEQGEPQYVAITEITDEEITVDGNHPFAGLDLNFDVEIMEVRDATEQELSAGRIAS